MIATKMIKDLSDSRKKFTDDRSCLEYLRKKRYPEGCPKCQEKLYPIGRSRMYACAKGHHISITVGTIFHKSRIPLNKWFYVIKLVTKSSAVTGRQVQREIDVNYESALRILTAVKKELTP